MALPSPHDTQPAEPVSTLEGQLREMYGRAAYTHKTHEKMADRYFTRYRAFKTTEIVLSAATASSLLLAVLGDTHLGTEVGAGFSAVLLGFTLYFKEAGLTEKAQKHSEVASNLWAIREALLSLLVDMNDGRDVEQIRVERDHINERLKQIYASAPRTDSAAYAAAQKALKDAEELSFTDAELNKMLPKQLRKNQG
ncbi:MAG TPA: SLATT domain-containing protein [Paraburkholderia sp.]|uniref:SLATT domain-containing protein n=1 Tax=Paraburkholderia sp. TaxID=1926495 RepID=UPI002B4A3C8A|nr:SLATT domain-containing protein [Paraburkholderia sp.]HKR40313.1 SLATT domain-containing protein [Paraburkholderia sp.]